MNRLTRQYRAMHIQSIPMWKGTGNNYAYIIKDKNNVAAIVDPAEPKSVLPVLKREIEAGLDLQYIITTHHHGDHAGGNKEILQNYPELKVIGGKDCACVQVTPKDSEHFKIGEIKVTALHTPCHTQDSICFFAEDNDAKAVFTGDTLFVAGCGRFFEGTAQEMCSALNKLRDLPHETVTYPGHEYTSANVRFASSVLQNQDVEKLEKFCGEGKETCGVFTIADELKWNPFMNLENPQITERFHGSPAEIMHQLRELKNNS